MVHRSSVRFSPWTTSDQVSAAFKAIIHALEPWLCICLQWDKLACMWLSSQATNTFLGLTNQQCCWKVLVVLCWTLAQVRAHGSFLYWYRIARAIASPVSTVIILLIRLKQRHLFPFHGRSGGSCCSSSVLIESNSSGSNGCGVPGIPHRLWVLGFILCLLSKTRFFAFFGAFPRYCLFLGWSNLVTRVRALLLGWSEAFPNWNSPVGFTKSP